MIDSTRDAAEEAALSFLRGFWASDLDEAMRHAAPDASWVFARSLPYERELPAREAMQRILDDMFESFDPEGFRIEHRACVSDGETVMVEYSAHGSTRSGRPYDNDYVMSISVADGKVTSVRPHTDTLHLVQLLMDEPQQEAG